MDIIIWIIIFCISIAILIWIHNISLNIWKIHTMMQEWDYDRKHPEEKEVNNDHK